MGKQPWGREEMSARNEAIEAARASPARRIIGAITGGVGLGLVFGSVAGAVYGALSRNRLKSLRVAPTWAGWFGVAGGVVNGYISATRKPEETEAVLSRLQAMDPKNLEQFNSPKSLDDLQRDLDELRAQEVATGVALDAEKRAVKRKLSAMSARS